MANKKLKIAFFETKETEKEHIKNKLKGLNLTFFKEELNLSTVKKAKEFDIVSVFIYSKLDKTTLGFLPNLKMIATRSTGFDHIDVNECSKRKIIVCNVPRYGDTTVAEHAFALILSLSRKINKSYERTVRADFSNTGLTGFDLRGKTIGIIGTGNIGRNVVRIAKGFEMEVLAYDAFPDKKFAADKGFKYVTLTALLKNSDIVTVHAPYNKSTHHLINGKNIKLMRKNAILINTARGAIVETKSLMSALVQRKIGGAGLDAIEDEDKIKNEDHLLIDKASSEEIRTLLENHILLKLDNVIITPHNAYNSTEALQRILDTSIENIKDFTKSKITNQVILKK